MMAAVLSPRTPEHQAKLTAHIRHLNEARRGTPLSPEHRAKVVKTLVPGPKNTNTPEAIAKMAAALVGNRNVQNAPVKGECAYCGAPATTRDHVLPTSRGGTDDPANIVDACLPCNSAKRGRTPEEWLAAGLYDRGAS